MIIIEPLLSDSVPVLDARSACYGSELMRYTEAELRDVVEALAGDPLVRAAIELQRRERMEDEGG